jgi:butyrate kinase
MENLYILVINPGSTSTKVGLYHNDTISWEVTVRHPREEILKYKAVTEQFTYRKNAILRILTEKNFDMSQLKAVCGRGGLLKPVSGGTYEINSLMLNDLKEAKYGSHASNLGAIISFEIANELNIKSYIVDPVVVDELSDIARYTGISHIKRRSIFHALNQKAIARKYASDIGSNYNDLKLIIAHLGGGITIGTHLNGKVIDVNNGLDGEGPFSPERAGTVPAGDLVELCFSGEYTKDQIKRMITGNGGLVSYFNSSNTIQLEELALNGDKTAEGILDAMCYQISKTIAANSIPLLGQVDAILITGGLAFSNYITNKIITNVSWISNVTIYPGENELLALGEGAARVVNGFEEAKIYQ